MRAAGRVPTKFPARNIASPSTQPSISARSGITSGTGRASMTRSANSDSPTRMKNTASGWAKMSSPNGRRSANRPKPKPAMRHHAVPPHPRARPTAVRPAARGRALAHIFTPFSVKYFTAPGCHGIGEFFVHLVGELDGLGLAVHGDQIVAVLDEGLDDVVGDLVRHAGVGDQDVLHRRDLVVLVLARIGLGRDDVGAVDAAVLGVHLVEHVGVVDQLDLDAGGGAEIGDRRGRQAADPEVGVDLAVLDARWWTRRRRAARAACPCPCRGRRPR